MSLTWKFSKGELIFQFDNGTRRVEWEIPRDTDEAALLDKLRDIVEVASPSAKLIAQSLGVNPNDLRPVTDPNPTGLNVSVPKVTGVPWNDEGDIDKLPIM